MHLPHSEIFFEKFLLLLPTYFVVSHYLTFQKDFFRVNLDIKVCKNIGQCGSKLPICPRWVIRFGKLTNITFA